MPQEPLIEPKMSFSPAVWLVWKVASAIADREQALIQPAHLLASVLVLAQEPGTPNDSDIKPEQDEVIRVLARHGLHRDDILRGLGFLAVVPPQLQSLPPGKQPPSRSPACKLAFDYAMKAAVEEAAACVQLRHLMGGIFYCCEDVYAMVGIDAALASILATSLSRGPAPDQPDEAMDIVLQAVDTSAVPGVGIDWTVVGPKFAALCELTWGASIADSSGALLQSLLEKLLIFIPSATHGAVLIFDPRTGDLDLKAHAPRGSVPLSRSSALQALDQKKAFIWQRRQDLSKTQIASNVESGVYAPIMTDGRSFGVLCLSTRSLAARFTPEDLFLAESLAHQIGVVLANRELKAEVAEKISVLERLMTNFSPQVRTHLISRAQAGRLKLGGERSNVSILCADIRGFTAMAAKMDTDDLLLLLNDYFAAMVECVFLHEGTIDKFIGDALLVVFGSPEAHPRHIEQAAKAALALQRTARQVSERRREKGLMTCEIGIGVHTGEVIHGFIGSQDRMEFTIIGDPVNMTTRYCAAAGQGEIMISPPIYEKLWREAEVESVEITAKHQGMLSAFKLLGLRTP